MWGHVPQEEAGILLGAEVASPVHRAQRLVRRLLVNVQVLAIAGRQENIEGAHVEHCFVAVKAFAEWLWGCLSRAAHPTGLGTVIASRTNSRRWDGGWVGQRVSGVPRCKVRPKILRLCKIAFSIALVELTKGTSE